MNSLLILKDISIEKTPLDELARRELISCREKSFKKTNNQQETD